MYQVSTLQALLLGYTKGVVSVGEFIKHGSIGLGTFANVNGEMIAVDGKVFKANNKGEATEVSPEEKIPFAAITDMIDSKKFAINDVQSIDDLKSILNNSIEEDFGLNSMHVIRIDGLFPIVKARSEEGLKTRHVKLSEILRVNQKDFRFENIKGTMVCLYFPDYMDGINAPGWHLHFISEDRTKGGHVFDLTIDTAVGTKSINHNIEIQLPTDAEFDTYSLKTVSDEEVKKVEQGKE